MSEEELEYPQSGLDDKTALRIRTVVNARVLLRPNNFDPLLTTYTC